MMAVCPVTTAGVPSEETRESAIAHIPKPTAPTPPNSFSPFVIMVCAPKKWGRRLHDRPPTIGGGAPAGHAHAFTSSRFCLCEPTLHSVLLVSTYDLMIIKRRCADFRDPKFTERSSQNFKSLESLDCALTYIVRHPTRIIARLRQPPAH